MEELIFPAESKDTVSKWHEYVPIIENKKLNEVTIHLMDGIEAPSLYAEACYVLEHTDADKVILRINNGGGHLDTYLSLAEAIKRSNATVVADISGTVASAATMVALACDELIVADHTSWMSHFYSGGVAGKGNEMRAQTSYTDKEMPKMFKAMHEGFFTKAEITKMVNGTDFWLNKEQVLTRWEKRAGLRDA